MVTRSSSAKTKINADHPRSPRSPAPHLPGHLALLRGPRLGAMGPWDKWGSCESGTAGGDGGVAGHCLPLPLSGLGGHRARRE